jgi:hypothetical protein
VEDDSWLTRLLQASHAALERLRDPALDVDRRLIADLEALCLNLEQRLSEARRTSDG